MTVDLVADVAALVRLYGATGADVAAMPADLRVRFYRFRLACLREELGELENARTPADAVDALVDLVVFALGTLVSFEVDAREAWRRVHAANTSKERGVKPERPNPWGLPDLVKPPGWVAPDHSDNVGLLRGCVP